MLSIAASGFSLLLLHRTLLKLKAETKKSESPPRAPMGRVARRGSGCNGYGCVGFGLQA